MVRRSVLTIAIVCGSITLGSMEAETAGQVVAVEVRDNYYKPQIIRVKPGDIIVFSNKGRQLHSMTLIDHEDLLDQAYIDPGMSFSFVMPNSLIPGEYALGCNVHVTMKARIIVERWEGNNPP